MCGEVYRGLCDENNQNNFKGNVSMAHLRNSPPSLLMIGNNYLKQLAFGARANSPVPIG